MAFKNLKAICEYTSHILAEIPAMLPANKYIGKPRPSMSPELLGIGERIEQNIEQIQKLISDAGFTISENPVDTSGVKEGAVIMAREFACFIRMASPHLLGLANEIGSNFTPVEDVSDSAVGMHLRIKSATPGDYPGTFGAANYYVTSNRMLSIDFSTDKFTISDGTTIAEARNVDIGWELNANVEVPIDLNILVHELVHAKWPPSIPQDDRAVHAATPKILETINMRAGGELRFIDTLERERATTLQAFHLLEREIDSLGIINPKPR